MSSVRIESMSSVDSAWLHMDSPANLMMVSGILVFDGMLEMDRLRQVVEHRLLRFDRFRQRVVESPGLLRGCRWEPDPEFDLKHHLVREDAQTLYGFATVEERALFRSLLRISGVGAKMGLGILSTMSVRDFHRCVEYEDTAMLVRIPGVGKKTAERLIIEMRDRIENIAAASAATKMATVASPRSEAVDALVALGYRPKEVHKLMSNLDVDGKTAEQIIRLALRQAAQ